MKPRRNFIIIIVSVIILVNLECKKSSKYSMEKKEEVNEFIHIDPPDIPLIDQSDVDLERITYLQKVGEIKEEFTEAEYNYFADIADICIDKDDNLYVADSKLRRIFKFNQHREYITSFGRQGQGPGEFLRRLRIRAGNDGKLYVIDDENFRLHIFSATGKFIRQFPLPKNVYNIAVANSRGEIYFLSESGLKVVDCFDSDFNYLRSLLGMNYQLNFPYEYPPKVMFRRMSMRPWRLEVHILLSKYDHISIIFNNSQIVAHFDQNNKLINQFRIDHPRFVKDYRKRLQDTTNEGRWINCFGSAFLDNSGFICLSYYNSNLETREIYRYKENGKFIDVVRIKDLGVKSILRIKACDSDGNFYGIDNNGPLISIYRKEVL